MAKKEINPNNLLTHAIVGYDKDNDYYGYLETSDDLDVLKAKFPEYKTLVHNDELRRDRDGEPFDWVFIEETATQKQLVSI